MSVGLRRTTLRTYLVRSRHPTYGILFTLPLLVGYEVFAWAMNAGRTTIVRNAADVWLRTLLTWLGANSTLSLSVILLVIGLLVALKARQSAPVPLEARVFGWMLAESICLALAFGTVVGGLTRLVLHSLPLSIAGQTQSITWFQQLTLSLGAGLYEELLFRVILIPAIATALLATGRISRTAAWMIAAIASALLFSGAHYVGPFGDPPALGSFIFRFLAGLAFSAILVFRGFGIVTWTHALYDVFLVLGPGTGG